MKTFRWVHKFSSQVEFTVIILRSMCRIVRLSGSMYNIETSIKGIMGNSIVRRSTHLLFISVPLVEHCYIILWQAPLIDFIMISLVSIATNNGTPSDHAQPSKKPALIKILIIMNFRVHTCRCPDVSAEGLTRSLLRKWLVL